MKRWGRVKRWLVAIRELFRRLPSARKEVHPNFVRAQLPQSCFTKRGPGVTAGLRAILVGFTQEQRQICRDRGWDKNLLRKSSGGKWRC